MVSDKKKTVKEGQGMGLNKNSNIWAWLQRIEDENWLCLCEQYDIDSIDENEKNAPIENKERTVKIWSTFLFVVMKKKPVQSTDIKYVDIYQWF